MLKFSCWCGCVEGRLAECYKVVSVYMYYVSRVVVDIVMLVLCVGLFWSRSDVVWLEWLFFAHWWFCVYGLDLLWALVTDCGWTGHFQIGWLDVMAEESADVVSELILWSMVVWRLVPYTFHLHSELNGNNGEWTNADDTLDNAARVRAKKEETTNRYRTEPGKKKGKMRPEGIECRDKPCTKQGCMFKHPPPVPEQQPVLNGAVPEEKPVFIKSKVMGFSDGGVKWVLLMEKTNKLVKLIGEYADEYECLETVSSYDLVTPEPGDLPVMLSKYVSSFVAFGIRVEVDRTLHLLMPIVQWSEKISCSQQVKLGTTMPHYVQFLLNSTSCHVFTLLTRMLSGR